MALRKVGGPLLAVALVGLATAILVAAGADLTVAALAYIAVVVASARFGHWAAGVAAVLSYASLNHWFTPRYESFGVAASDDMVLLVAFALAATVAAITVARVNALRRRAAEQEQAAVDARVAAALNESRAGFLSSMTHNLRTPLATIKASVSTLQESSSSLDEPTRRRLLAGAREETERLERLVTKVLELSRIHAGAIDPRPEPTDIAELTRGAVRRLRFLAARDRVELAVAGDVVTVSVDPAMIELVLVVLLENALRFAPAGTSVSVVVEPSGVAGCRIHVIDHGPGIPVQFREKVFEEFVRLDGQPDGSSSGLGLAIAAAFVDAHGGTIRIDDTPGGGATFTVTLPGDTA
ncbi:MAG TPA: ATP-binding protein [Acidimicrobiia bacterium]|nr:ATP-binding protein [Acidimicrobiia bacterium]